MANIREQEVLQTNLDGRPIAVSYDPGSFSNDTIRTILNNQISSPSPLEIHCRIGSVFITIESWEFELARNDTQVERDEFTERAEKLIKGIDTHEIIFAEPLEQKI